MLQLCKYEFRKTRPAKLILAGIVVLLEGFFLWHLFRNEQDPMTLDIGLLALAAFCGMIVIGLQSIVTLHRDMNSRQGYMLFMTPHSCYAILGAKVLECCLSILIAVAFFFGLGILDVTLMFDHFGQLEQLMKMVNQFVQAMGREISLNTAGIAAFVFALMTEWMLTVLAAFLADVISAALLKGKKGNGFVSFLIFIGLMLLVSAVMELLPENIPAIPGYVAIGCVSLGLTAGMYWITAVLMERKLSV